MSLPIIQITTLVDITPTGVTRSCNGKELERNQQRNWETVVQILSLRTQPHILSLPYKIPMQNEFIQRAFGDFYHGHQSVWRFEFTADYIDAYSTNDGPISGLVSDFKEIPIITGLTDTARFMLPIFYTEGIIKNIHFMIFSSEFFLKK